MTTEFVEKLVENPMPRKIKDGRIIYLSHNNFGPLRSLRVLPKIADFGLDSLEPLRYPIQPLTILCHPFIIKLIL